MDICMTLNKQFSILSGFCWVLLFFFPSSPQHMARQAAKDPEQEWRAIDYKKGGTELFTL